MTKKKLTQQILTGKDEFLFVCKPGVECYTSCCGNVNIFLAPYDVIRLRKKLNMGSREFLDRYTTILKGSNPLVPLVLLKMDESEKKRCQFVTEDGCQVYDDRPWACRMFPLDLEIKGKYSFITDEKRCKGLLQDNKWKVSDWLETQGIKEYEEWNALHEEITGDRDFHKLDVNNPQIRRMMFMATYDLDAFREFVFETKFLEMFDLGEERIQKVREDELELLRLGMDWIKFGLFGEKTLKLNPQALEAQRKAAESAPNGA